MSVAKENRAVKTSPASNLERFGTTTRRTIYPSGKVVVEETASGTGRILSKKVYRRIVR